MTRKSKAVLATILCFGCGTPERATPASEQTDAGRQTEWAASSGLNDTMPSPDPNSEFRFAWAGDSVVLRADGQGTRRGVDGAREFVVPVQAGYAVKRLSTTALERDLLILFEQGDAVSGSSGAILLDGSTLKALWFTPLDGFNLSTGLVDSLSLYVATISILARIDLRTGRIVWRRDDLVSSARCDAYDYPRLAGDTLTVMCSGTRPDRFRRQDGTSF